VSGCGQRFPTGGVESGSHHFRAGECKFWKLENRALRKAISIITIGAPDGEKKRARKKAYFSASI